VGIIFCGRDISGGIGRFTFAERMEAGAYNKKMAVREDVGAYLISCGR